MNVVCITYMLDTRIYTHQKESFVLICFSCGVYLNFVCSGCAINLRDSTATRLVYREFHGQFIYKMIKVLP